MAIVTLTRNGEVSLNHIFKYPRMKIESWVVDKNSSEKKPIEIVLKIKSDWTRYDADKQERMKVGDIIEFIEEYNTERYNEFYFAGIFKDKSKLKKNPWIYHLIVNHKVKLKDLYNAESTYGADFKIEYEVISYG